MQHHLKITFIGGGNMAAALIGGMVGALTAAENIHVIDIQADACHKMRQQFGVGTAQHIDAHVAQSDVLVLAVKPQHMKDIALQLRPHLSSQLLLSIAAGIRMSDLSRWLQGYGALVRTMPNMPALIGRGITGMVALAGVSVQQREVADAIMRTVGETMWLTDEALLDAVTALSGSGPAYVFYFIEAMADVAQEMGLSAAQGAKLAIATFGGAAQLAAQSPESVSTLRERVTSQGGTTHAALRSMEQSGIKEAIGRAIKAAAARSQTLGDEFGRS